MTKEAIEARINVLRQQYEQTIANSNAIQGAIQDCEYWLKTLEAPQEPKE
jgi:hypothetical protein